MPTEPTNVLFVCTGNICRSPVAEKILQQRSVQLGLGLEVRSAGTRALNGKPMHPESVRLLRERGIDPGGFASRLLTADLTAGADLVLGLTREHRGAARQLAPARWRRIHALREASGDGPRSSGSIEMTMAVGRFTGTNDARLDIEDPIGRPSHVFDSVAEDIEATMDDLVAWIEHQRAQHSTVQQVAK